MAVETKLSINGKWFIEYDTQNNYLSHGEIIKEFSYNTDVKIVNTYTIKEDWITELGSLGIDTSEL